MECILGSKRSGCKLTVVPLFPLKVKFVDAELIQKPLLTSKLFKAIRRKPQILNRRKLALIGQEQSNAYNNWVTAQIRKSKTTRFFMNSFASRQNDLNKLGPSREILTQSSTQKLIKSVKCRGEWNYRSLEKFNLVQWIFQQRRNWSRQPSPH